MSILLALALLFSSPTEANIHKLIQESGIWQSRRLRFEAALAVQDEFMLSRMGEERGFKDKDDDEAKNRFLNQLVYTIEPIGTYVGQLQEKWQFPSDHLPVGVTWGEHHIASWNVLDSEYINWVIEKDSQGLKNSLIGEEHVYIDGSKLTIRDQHVVRLVIDMLKHPTHPKNIFALQECNATFINELIKNLPESHTVLAADEFALIFNKEKFQIIDNQYVDNIFSEDPLRTVQVVTLKSEDQKVKIINAHLPGNPLKPARFEFANFLAKTFDPHIQTIALGDMNFNECEMQGAIFQSFGDKSPFSQYIPPYCTNITPFKFDSKIIDQFFIKSCDRVQINGAEEVLIGLSPTASLLEGKT